MPPPIRASSAAITASSGEIFYLAFGIISLFISIAPLIYYCITRKQIR